MKTLVVDQASPFQGRLAKWAKPFLCSGLVVWTMLLASVSSGAVTTLYSFTNKFDGSQPYAGLVLGNDGNFYGTCFDGGTNGFGSIFRIPSSGAFTPLHSFSFIDGETPTAGLTLGTDGSFYGTTFEGGTNDYGTVFQISSNGVFTSLYSFTNGIDGANPYGGLAQGGNGMFYGTTSSGGVNNNGIFFQITSAGEFTPLYYFNNGVDGSQPRATLSAANGVFYGTTYAGGSSGKGVVFSITSGGAISPLHSFNGGSDGANPVGQLTQGTNGVLYGTAYAGGSNGFGTVFQIIIGGAFSPLYSFTGGSDGGSPAAGLALGSDGNFYGTTYSGGPAGDGGIFKITPQGTLTPLYLFTDGNDGSSSMAKLVQGIDGDFYGTTQFGGADNDGVVFKINSFGAPPVLTSVAKVSGTIEITWSGLPGQSYQAQYATNLNQINWSNLGGPVATTNSIGSQVDDAPVDPARFYRVYLVP